MTTESTCCQPASDTPASTTSTHTAVATDVAPSEATRVTVCCGSAADAATAGSCCDPAAKRAAVVGGATCCS